MRISRKATWKRVDLSGSLKKEKGKGLATRETEMRKWTLGEAVRTYTTFIEFVVLYEWALFVVPQNNYNSNIRDH